MITKCDGTYHVLFKYRILTDSKTGTEIDENPVVEMSKVVNANMAKALTITGGFGRILQVRKVHAN